MVNYSSPSIDPFRESVFNNNNENNWPNRCERTRALCFRLRRECDWLITRSRSEELINRNSENDRCSLLLPSSSPLSRPLLRVIIGRCCEIHFHFITRHHGLFRKHGSVITCINSDLQFDRFNSLMFAELGIIFVYGWNGERLLFFPFPRYLLT